MEGFLLSILIGCLTLSWAPASSCPCKSQIVDLEGELKATQEELRLQILNVQEQVRSRFAKLERRNRHQIKVLDMLNQERAAAERRDMIQRIKQTAAQSRLEVHLRQAAASHKLKTWLMSRLQNGEQGRAARPRYCRLLPSPSVKPPDSEALPLLSMLSGESSTSLATYVNVLPSTSSYSVVDHEQEPTLSRTYFEMKVDKSSGAAFPSA
ncbi:hypothetical protein LDENG_00190270 [Lucifuga dentata]|nr:hypothetical protein LDENG_00190270 [Lucifuga dentata]